LPLAIFGLTHKYEEDKFYSVKKVINSSLTFYDEVLGRVDNWLKENYRSGGLLIESIPQPENLYVDGLGQAEYHRIAVAYGLSIPEYDLGKIISPTEIDDLPPPDRIDYSDRFISKDQM